MIKIRDAETSDRIILLELYKFICSIGVELSKKLDKELFLEILKDCFESSDDRFSYSNCKVMEEDGSIVAFYFSYDFSKLEKAKIFWTDYILKKYSLNDGDLIFDYDEFFEGEIYLDTLYVLEAYRSKGLGSRLLKDFLTSNSGTKSLNVSKRNIGAKKLYESFGMKKSGEILIAGEYYDHMIL